MIPKIITATPNGYQASLVEIETIVSNGLPVTIVVGLPDTIVQESRERVRAAIKYSGYSYPASRISINLAPGDLPKIGSHFDLALALSILLADGLIAFNPSHKMFIGELALDGSVRPASGVLSMVLAAKQAGIKEVFVPQNNDQEASLVKGLKVFEVTSLESIVSHLTGKGFLQEKKVKTLPHTYSSTSSINTDTNNMVEVDFAEISGQFIAKRALVIAASGSHNIRMVGPPGSGKTLLAKALAGILPDLTEQEILETTNLYSLAGRLSVNQDSSNYTSSVVTARPFRSPHHTASSLALIGGGGKPRPGEISLAHNGVLFLDELTEFPRKVLEVLRQPLEEHKVIINRAQRNITFPAKFILVTAQNPCHCGNYGDPLLDCICHPSEVLRYNKKISGPLLDRIDLHINVPRLKYDELKITSPSSLSLPPPMQTSMELRTVVNSARQIQKQRFSHHESDKKLETKTNSEMTSADLKKYCSLPEDADKLLQQAADNYQLSARSIAKILKVARTIADIENQENIQTSHLAESLQYRIINTT